MSKHYREQLDGFTMSWFSGDERVYIAFPETDAGEAGAVIMDIDILESLMDATIRKEGNR